MDAPPEARLTLEIRQACAEGREKDAYALFEGAPATASRWFLNKVVSRTDEAESILRNAEIEHT